MEESEREGCGGGGKRGKEPAHHREGLTPEREGRGGRREGGEGQRADRALGNPRAEPHFGQKWPSAQPLARGSQEEHALSMHTAVGAGGGVTVGDCPGREL